MGTPEALAAGLGLARDEVRAAGRGALKVSVAAVRDRASRPGGGRLVLVTGMTPTKHGEGKTVTVIGLTEGLTRRGARAVACLRQPSLGPVFGVKGGATGGGRATVEPAATINLGFTGDIHAVAEAHNLLASLVDNHLYHGNALDIERSRVLWPRTLDVEDRALRHVVTGTGVDPRQPAQESSFVITAASEVMVVLALARDYADLKTRLGRILVAYRGDGSPVRAADLHATGAMTAVLRDALEPNLVATGGGAPAIIHTGPFGNLAHGTTSRLAIELALATADYCVVEAGFATELGAEKFVDIVTPVLGRDVDVAVLVVTLRSLRVQGGVSDADALLPAPQALERGLANLEQHLANLAALGPATVVALNRFPGDSPEEVERLVAFCREREVGVVGSGAYEQGGDGCLELAAQVEELSRSGRRSHPLYPAGTPVPQQLDLIVRQLYGGAGVRLLDEATVDLRLLLAVGETAGPVCVAKTPLSLSDDAKQRGRPTGFVAQVHRFSRSAGAGFTVAYLGAIETMPGLPARPAAEQIDVRDDGEITGLQ